MDPNTDPKPDDTPAPKDNPKPDDTPDFQAEAEKWKALARKHESQAKANADAAKKLAEMEDAEKSEVQRLAEKQTAAEERAAKAEREVLRLRVASRKGLTEAQAKRLQGDTEEELEADADDLLESFTVPDDDKPAGTQRPKERLRPGAAPDAEPEKSPDELADAVVARRGY